MVKDLHQRNRKHTTKRDRKGERERSKAENAKKKLADRLKVPVVLDARTTSKIIEILKELVAHNEEVRTELPGVAEMLDSGHDVEVADVEDLFVREKLERVLELFEGFVERVENDEGAFVFRKVSEQSLKEQVTQLLMRAVDSHKRQDWMNSMADTLAAEIGPALGPSFGPALIAKESQEDLEEYMETYNREHRPKTLLELHQENRRASTEPTAVLYGHKNLNKRFAQGKFQTQFMCVIAQELAPVVSAASPLG